MGGLLAGVGHEGELFEEFFAVGFGQAAEDFRLEFERERAEEFVSLAAVREEADAVGAAVRFVGGAFEEKGGFHAFEEGSDGVRVAGNGFGDLALGKAFGIGFDEGAQDGELVGSDFEVEDAATERLVKPVPGAAQKRGEAAAFGRIKRKAERIPGLVH